MEKLRKKVGLALGSGGVRGLAHIGVLKVLIKKVVSTSIIMPASPHSVGDDAMRSVSPLASRYSGRVIIQCG